MTRKMGNDTLGRERRRDLRSRIAEIRNAAWRESDNKPPNPAHVKAARKVVDAYDKRQKAASIRRRDSILLATKAAQRELLSTESFDDGLRIVSKLEATAKRRGWINKEETQE